MIKDEQGMIVSGMWNILPVMHVSVHAKMM